MKENLKLPFTYSFNDDNSSITMSHHNYFLGCCFRNKVLTNIDKVLFRRFTALKKQME